MRLGFPGRLQLLDGAVDLVFERLEFVAGQGFEFARSFDRHRPVFPLEMNVRAVYRTTRSEKSTDTKELSALRSTPYAKAQQSRDGVKRRAYGVQRFSKTPSSPRPFLRSRPTPSRT